jgi:hypothetical protein
MLIHLLGLEQFSQGVSKKFSQPCFRWLKRSYETNVGMQNMTQTAPKWNWTKSETNPKNKRNRTKEKHKKGGTLAKIKQPN